MNQIDKIRREISSYFNPDFIIQNSGQKIISTSRNYRVETMEYRQDKVESNWNVIKIDIYDEKTNEKIFDFFVNHDLFCHEWIEINNIEYLICSEDIYGGQTVIDLTNRKMSSYSPGNDGFIWTNFFLSPDKNIIAIIGCFWACPSIIKIYDFRQPMGLPLHEIQEIEMLDNDEIILCWLDNESFKTKRIKRERTPEYYDKENIRFKVIKEEVVERVIRINKSQNIN